MAEPIADHGLSEQMREQLAKMCREVLRPRMSEVDEKRELPRENLKMMAEMGLFGIEVPEAYGGIGLGPTVHAMVCEELSWACPSSETVYRAQSLVAHPLVHFGSEEQKQKYLPGLAQGDLAAFGLSEPVAGSDVQGIQTRAEHVDGGYRITGQKTFASNAGVSQLYLIFARTGEKGGRFASAFLVPSDRTGLEIGPKLHKMGRHGSVTAPIYLDGVEVSEAERLGEEGDGLRIAFHTMVHGRILQAAAGIGIARAVFEIACDYAKERHAFGRAIGGIQAVQLKLADMAIELEAARGLQRRALELLEGGEDANMASAILKVFASRMGINACRSAMNILGGYGYMKEYLVETFYRDIQLFEIAEGQNDVLCSALIARQLGMPAWNK